MNIQSVGLITKRNSSRVRKLGHELAGWFKERGIDAQLDTIEPEMDMLVILGGDGTLLHVADRASRYDIPVIGINLGYLGFLTEVAENEMFEALQEVLEGRGQIEKRMMLRIQLASSDQEQAIEPLFGLNEVVIVKGNVDKVIRLCSWADEEYITTYKADGLIISTPTGSTAYNLSAGGPIVHLEKRVDVRVTKIELLLESRPVLLAPQTRITTQLAGPASDVKVMVDGRFSWNMRENDCLIVEAAAKPLQLYSSPNKGYFTILRNKLNWGGRETGCPLPRIAASARKK